MGRSLTCLFAKTRSTASRSSSSASILISSSRASFTRSRSLLSTTNINPREAEHGLHKRADEVPAHPPPKDNTLRTPSKYLFLFLLCSHPYQLQQGKNWLLIIKNEGHTFCSYPTNPYQPGQFICHTLGVLEVVSPERPNLVLATHIPNCEADILVLHCLHVEPFGKDNGHLASNTRSTNNTPVGSFPFLPAWL